MGKELEEKIRQEELKEKVDKMELMAKIDALYRVIGELYVENLRLKAINKLAIKKDEK